MPYLHKGKRYSDRRQLPKSLYRKWEDFGYKMGYPRCCIAAFLKDEQVRGDKHFSGTGFLRCKACHEKDPREILKYIDENRKVPFKFPFADQRELDNLKNTTKISMASKMDKLRRGEL